MEKVYLVECYTGSTVTDEKKDNFVSAIYKTMEGATKYVEKQIENWRNEKKVPKEIGTTPKNYEKTGKQYVTMYNGEYIIYYITKVTVEE